METKAAILGCRNDGWKEDERVIVCLTSMIETFDEVWFCDWNSPSDKGPLLWKLKDQIPKTGKIRHFIIPEEVANIIKNIYPNISPYALTLVQNLLIRRCTADWIASTTMDIVAPKKEYFDEFINKANKDTFYTVSRRDVEYSELEQMGFENWRQFRNKMDVETKPQYYPARVTPNDNYSLINCCGDFQLAHKNIWNKVKGFEEQMLYSCFNDTNVQKKAVLNGYNLEAQYDLPLYHLSHRGMGNDGSSPSKQHYNNAYDWVERFEESQNTDSWGFADTEIEFEII
jgi:protein tyrosine phosphatase